MMPRAWMCAGYGGPEVDAAENQRNRRRQIAQLARYGRQSMLQWDDVDLLRFLELYGALVDLMDAERDEGGDAAGFFENAG